MGRNIAETLHGIIDAVGCVNEDGVFVATHDDYGEEEPAKALDANDVHRKLGTAAARALTDRLPDIDFEDKPKARGNGQLEVNSEAFARNRTQQGEQKAFPLIAWKDIDFNIEEECRVEGVLPLVGLACLYGGPGSGKTFILLDLFARMARGGFWGG